MKQKCAAVLTIKRPGAMTAAGRKRIATWIKKQATALVKDGKDYNEKGNFIARYLFSEGD